MRAGSPRAEATGPMKKLTIQGYLMNKFLFRVILCCSSTLRAFARSVLLFSALRHGLWRGSELILLQAFGAQAIKA